VEAVAASQIADYAQQVEASAQAGAELAGRMRKAGNWSALDLAREQAYHAQTVADVTHARNAAVAAREKLTRLLGLSGSRRRRTACPIICRTCLPRRASWPTSSSRGERTAGYQAARLDTEQTAATLGLTRTTRFINVLDLGAVRNSEGGGHARL
jgi:outer membrane protein TolC